MLVMNGNGGTVSSKDVAREAAKTVMSGPASGVIAALNTGQAAGLNHLITYDMGGTSTDVSVIKMASRRYQTKLKLNMRCQSMCR
jgi:N-methylhydantoinase A